MSKNKQELQTTNNNSLIHRARDVQYAEGKQNKKNKAWEETIVTSKGDLIQKTNTKTGTEIFKGITRPVYSDTKERNESMRDLAKNDIKQKDNALLHDVSQSTVSRVVNEPKK
ncbi:MAG: hypothetical protein LBN00_07820 [Oscillospiraceae bacterium]|jgi:hypothetical protein|nr:hypothetical protein [Oscillospiraceae bacterium]